jgi:hypothetical protein
LAREPVCEPNFSASIEGRLVTVDSFGRIAVARYDGSDHAKRRDADPEKRGLESMKVLSDALRILPDLSLDLATMEGREAIRMALYALLEDDGRPDCRAVLESHDVNKGEVDALAGALVGVEGRVFVLEDPQANRVEKQSVRFIRDRAFRLAVLPEYGFACALCSARLRWNNLVEAEAAHIKPRSKRGPDDIRNGLSLCQTHHWAFDVGMWSATDTLVVMVAKSDSSRGDDLEAICRFEGARLRTPGRASASPHPLALEWHRDVRFGRAS